MKMKFYIIGLLLLSSSTNSFAQDDILMAMMRDSLFREGICDDSGFCIPKLQGLPRSKGLQINYRRILNYEIDTQFKDSTNTYSDFIDRNRRFTAKLRVPVVLRPKLQIVVGAKYEIEEFRFENPETLDNSFYQALENKPLRSLGMSLYVIKPLEGKHYVITRASLRFSGDFSKFISNDYQRSTVSVIFGTRASSSKTWGFGVSYGYTFGQRAIYPILAYAKKITDKLSFDVVLPVSIRMRYILKEKNVFSLKVNAEGDKYNLNFDDFTPDKLYLEKSDLLATFTYEREIYDFLWMSMSVGARTNLSFNLSEFNTYQDRGVPEISNTIGNSVLYRVGIFLVPPKNMKRKL